jgi:hypothetical protein
MWAKIESNTIIEIYTRPKALIIDNIQYPSNIFGLWTSVELEAIGIYEVVIDNTNFKDKKYYINTNQTYAFASDTVTSSYGTATAKALTDVLFTAAEEEAGLGTEGEVAVQGLKSIHKEQINNTAVGLLQPTDWMVVRAAEGGTAVPSAWTTYRAAVRTKSNDMETLIDATANVDALAALYIYNSDDPPVRPLGEWPSELS